MIAALPLDASRRQLFVPLQLLESHGSGMEEVFAGKQTPKLRAALDQLIGEARAHLKTAFALLANVPPEVRPVFLPLALVAPRSEADVARRQRSVRAACDVAVSDAVDAVAGVAIAAVSERRQRDFTA